jgi:hypothetical protein
VADGEVGEKRYGSYLELLEAAETAREPGT